MLMQYYVHHFIAFICNLVGIIAGVCVGQFVCIIMFMELSTIFLEIRQIMMLLKLDKKHSTCFIVNGILLVAAFFLVRVAFVSYV